MQSTLLSSPPSAPPDDKDEEETCPVCGAKWTKKKPTLSEVRSAISYTVASHKAEIKAFSEVMVFGYCGSVATGAVRSGKPHVGMEPDIRGECGTKYDVDGFMISSPLTRRIKKFNGKRWARLYKPTRDFEKKLRNDLKANPALQHLKGGKGGFSIAVYAPNEEDKVIAKGCKILIT